ncbi:reverse transcriptase domain-containing protein [Paenibacillus sp. NPDC056933]|uniref:reverse transcriptase domain-containing protein n=1 Tax=Paenibacillus sp. NPDC056933 TaxID=3345968 RepID=UPI003635C6C5
MARQVRLTLSKLVSNGYFPAELIPAFNTKELGNIVNDILPSLTGMNININSEKIYSSKGCLHTIPRILHHRRTLTIPNPFHQIKVFDSISTNWTEIKKTINSSRYSMTKPLIKKDSLRAIERRYSFNDIPYLLPTISSNSRYLLKTDISRYYPTIYTHSIPWACHGKSFAKQKSNRGNGHYGNLLDLTVRNTQDQQTIGIPIGPDSSLVISELIGAAIDKQIYLETKAQGIRYLDDMYFFFNSISDAEEALTKIQNITKIYELEINPEKTQIYSLPLALEPDWTSEIRNYRFRSSIKGQRTDLVTFFSKAYEYSRRYPNDYILKYSLSRMKHIIVQEANWPLYQSLILNAMIAEPSVLPTATEIFIKYKNLNYDLNYKELEQTINNIIFHHSKLGHGYEISWSLWLAKNLRLKINRASAKQISQMDDCISMLTALDLRDKGLIPSGLSTTDWNKYLKPEALYEEHWLFAYEAVKKGWMTPRNNYLLSDPFFSILNLKNVNFYNADLYHSSHQPLNTQNKVVSENVTFFGSNIDVGY